MISLQANVELAGGKFIGAGGKRNDVAADFAM
jgi:hypothetical protein